jgi:hypothetical protein
MRRHAIVGGRLEFKNEESYARALALLEAGRWVIGNHWWNSLGGAVGTLDGTNSIHVPVAEYAGLAENLDEITAFASSYHIAWGSYDPIGAGVVSSQGRREIGEVELEAWARRSGVDEPPKSDSGELGEEYYDWLDQVILSYVYAEGSLAF